MTPAIAGLLLLAGLLHATWNAILRSGKDRLWSITMMGLVAALLALPFVLLLPKPEPPSWPFLACSAALQVGYCLFLVRAYRHGHLAHAYPIARGTAPLLVTLGAWLIAHEQLSSMEIVGIVLVSGGVYVLTFGGDRPDRRSTSAALLTGAFIAAYTIADGVGVRLSGQALAYVAWQTALQGAAIFATFTLIRRGLPAIPRGSAGISTVFAAVIGAAGYGVAIWAMSIAPMAQVSALRETSILFAILIGTVILREPLSWPRIIGGGAIAVGAICLAAL